MRKRVRNRDERKRETRKIPLYFYTKKKNLKKKEVLTFLNFYYYLKLSFFVQDHT